MDLKKYAVLALLVSSSFDAHAIEDDGMDAADPFAATRSNITTPTNTLDGIQDIIEAGRDAAAVVKTVTDGGASIVEDLRGDAATAGRIVNEVTVDPVKALLDASNLIITLQARCMELEHNMAGVMQELSALREKAKNGIHAVGQGVSDAVDEVGKVAKQTKVLCGC